MAKINAGKQGKTNGAATQAKANGASRQQAKAGAAAKPKAAAAKAPAAKAPSAAQTGSEEAYQAHLAEATALPASSVTPLRRKTSQIYQTVLDAVNKLSPHKDKLAEDLPNEDLTVLDSLPDLALGLVFAGLQVRRGGVDPTLQQALTDGRALRGVLLRGAHAAADAGIFAQADVDAVQKGRGPLDMANDLIALSSMFKGKKAALAGKSAITNAQVAKAAEVGAWLQANIKSAGSAKKTKAALAKAADVRDRFGALVAQGYERLWVMGVVVWGYEVGGHVRPLLGRAVRVSVAKRAVKAQHAATKAAARAQKAVERAAKVKGRGKKAAAPAAGVATGTGATPATGGTSG